MKENYKNTKENCDHYNGKVWLSKGGTGKNICLDIGREEFLVIAFVPAKEINEKNVRDTIKARGFRVDDFMEA